MPRQHDFRREARLFRDSENQVRRIPAAHEIRETA